jgi:nitrite reductase/ring-hydroxylating ferredoxin subunit
MSREQLIEMTRHAIDHAHAGTIDQEPDVMKIPAANYYDPDRFKVEVKQIFRRMPLVLAPSAEIRNPGDYKSMDAAGMPVLLTRGQDGEVRAFINSCSHRGTAVVIDETGNRRKFTCPYHGWTFDQKGALVGIASPDDFGEIDRSAYGLTPLPVLEKAGLIWCTLDPESTLDIETFLSGYDDMLANFGLESWHLFEKRTIRGPNWKIAYDGYMDLYHLPVLHRDTFGADRSNKALYFPWGPHQRVISPNRYGPLENLPEDKWPTAMMMVGVWTIFPHISIASFEGGGRSIMLSQLFPGSSPGESYTTQYYLMEHEPNEEQAKEAEAQFKLLEYVVEVEDYGTGLRQQKALEAGGRDHVLFGRNEGGGHRFHGWVDRLIEADDKELNGLFASA